MSEAWKPKYPIDKLPQTLWKSFPEWFINEDHPNALRHCIETLGKVNAWQTDMIRQLVSLYDWLEKERKESRGEIPVQACYVFQKSLIELVLGCKIGTVKRFLADMGLEQQEVESLI